MIDIFVKRLKEELVRQRYNYKSLSLAAGLGETTVRDIIIGRARNPRRDTLQKIAKVLGVPLVHFLIENDAVTATEISEQSAVLYDINRDYTSRLLTYNLQASPQSVHAELGVIRLQGNALLPFLPKGSELYYNRKKIDNFQNLIGTLCVVQTKKGLLDAGILKDGSIPGRYNLENHKTLIRENMNLKWCAKVILVKL